MNMTTSGRLYPTIVTLTLSSSRFFLSLFFTNSTGVSQFHYTTNWQDACKFWRHIRTGKLTININACRALFCLVYSIRLFASLPAYLLIYLFVSWSIQSL